MIKIDMYPSPIIYDEATTEGEYFVNAISPGMTVAVVVVVIVPEKKEN